MRHLSVNPKSLKNEPSGWVRLLHAELRIKALRSLQDDNGMGVFECHISGPGITAEARLNVFRPPQIASYLQEPDLESPL